jgi:preprotein translocase subunit SecA
VNGLITRSLETAQTRIEGFNFDSRKHVLEYDDVMNIHRTAVYKRRRTMLLGSDEDVVAELMSIVDETNEEVMGMIKSKREQMGGAEFAKAVRNLFLQTIDMFWVEHLEAMDYLRSSVNLRAYGQRDPLVEYKREGLMLFKSMQNSVNGQVITLLPNVGGMVMAAALKPLNTVESDAKGILAGDGSSNAASGGDKTGRNEKVVIIKGGEEREVKFKKLDQYLRDGWIVKK